MARNRFAGYDRIEAIRFNKGAAMFKRLSRSQLCAPLLMAIMLILSTMACGGQVSPTKVGEVGTQAQPKEEETTEPIATEESSAEEPVVADTQEAQVPVSYGVGDIISIGDVVMLILGWDTPQGDDLIKPDEGKKFIAVDILLVNQSSETIAISSMLQMGLKDDTGQKYIIDLMASTATGSSAPDGEIAPGRAREDRLSSATGRYWVGLCL